MKKNFIHILLDTLAAIYVAFYVFLYSVLILISPIMVLAFKSPPFDYTFVVKRWTFSFRLQKKSLTSGERVMVVQFCAKFWAVKHVICTSAP